MIVIAAVVGGYILSHENLKLPSWVPVLGQSYFTLKGEFQTAQAVTPGQGQAVTIAGAKIGEIASVDLHNGVAMVTMHLVPKYAKAHLPRRDDAAAPEDPAEGHDGRGDPGRPPAGGCAAAKRSRCRRPLPTSTSTNSSRGWTAKRAPTCRSCWPARAKG